MAASASRSARLECCDDMLAFRDWCYNEIVALVLVLRRDALSTMAASVSRLARTDIATLCW